MDEPRQPLPPVPQRHRTPRLTRRSITDAAVAIADRDGLAAVTMRRVGEELGAGAMSLYRHVANREQLLDSMIDAVYSELDVPVGPTAQWRRDVVQLARAQRRVVRAHPWVAALVGSRPPLLPSFLRPFEFSLGALQGAGFDISEAAGAAATINAFVVGFVLLEQAEDEARLRTGMTRDAWRDHNARLVERILAGGDYPIIKNFVELAEDVDPDTAFENALGHILDGFETSLHGNH
jgi:AcrR family transcriptional regulator